MDNKLDIADLSELLQFALFYKDLGHLKLQIDTEDMITVLDYALAYAQQKG